MGAVRSSHLTAIFLVAAALGGGSWSVGAAPAQGYPNHMVKLVIPFVAGGPLDITARAIADKLSTSLKQPIVIENRPGAGGNIGTEVIARAAPDGYTLGIVLGTTLTVNPSLYGKFPFDPDKDIRPIAIVTTSGNMLVVHPSVPANSVPEFVTFAKASAARKDPIAYASSGGIGSPGHLVMEYFRLRADFAAVHVPYRGNPPMVLDLVAGQVKVGFVTSAGMVDHVQAGRLKALGVARDRRSPLAPNVPTVAESGYPGFNVENYYVMLAPAGLPGPIAGVLEREVSAALRHPDVIEQLRAMDTTADVIIGAEARARLKADREAWSKVVVAAGMRLD
jgi:tripartite-type tricarboxylate transporter receptor subunit TctC